MEVSRNPENAPEGVEVLAFFMVGTDQVAVLARPAWVNEIVGNQPTTTRVLRWQATLDGEEVPREWRAYAYATFEAPDPGA